MSEQPFEGYVCSSFGKTAASRLRVAEAKGCKPKTGSIRRRLTDSDILFFSGHHYARYDGPLEFDAIDLNKQTITASKVRLIMVSSCLGLRANALARFRRKFPNACIFGWLSNSPLNQKGLMSKFIESVDAKIDLHSKTGMEQLIQKWRDYI